MSQRFPYNYIIKINLKIVTLLQITFQYPTYSSIQLGTCIKNTKYKFANKHTQQYRKEKQIVCKDIDISIHSLRDNPVQ